MPTVVGRSFLADTPAKCTTILRHVCCKHAVQMHTPTTYILSQAATAIACIVSITQKQPTITAKPPKFLPMTMLPMPLLPNQSRSMRLWQQAGIKQSGGTSNNTATVDYCWLAILPAAQPNSC
eukprot:GHRR01001684.1.p3 GENE.GHRR01001684.1~~GHRR01001684.1.p3  ORF type:complete len:123 (-),score=25.00 GHRR01001684.1:1546-1914(-)